MRKSVLSFTLLAFSFLLAACQTSYLMIPVVQPVPDSAVVTPTRARFQFARRTPTAQPASIATATVDDNDNDDDNDDAALSSAKLTATTTPSPSPSREAIMTPTARITSSPATSSATPTMVSADSDNNKPIEKQNDPTTPPFLVVQEQPQSNQYPTLADFWQGSAEFKLDARSTGLPMGESDTIVMGNGELWSYVHASHPSAGVVDQCGDPVPFPGCVVIYKSYDGGYTFQPDGSPVCQFECKQCPCGSGSDHIDQQQYPRVFFDGQKLTMFYEYRAQSIMRHSWDGLNWTQFDRVLRTGVWKLNLRPCEAVERIKEHPFAFEDAECLAGGPPGIYIEGNRLYLFVAVGQNPSGMGCYVTNRTSPGYTFTPCEHHQLFSGSWVYGPPHEKGPHTNQYFDFRTVSSAEVQKIGTGENARYYMLYEGVRGPGEFDRGDSQFGLGLARSLTNRIDAPWEKYADNPILVDLPGNIGLGHSDLVVYNGQTLLYTSLDGVHRSRMSLIWK